MTEKTSIQPSQGTLTGLLKGILFRESLKHPRLQHLWSRLHTISIFGMNYGGGGLIESSGEPWVLREVVAKRCDKIARPIIFDVGANIGDYSLTLKRFVPAAMIYAFEPAKSVFQQLTATIAAAQAEDQIKPCNFGFSDSERTVEFFSYTVEGNEASVLSSIDQRLPTQALDVQTQGSEKVEVRTIDRSSTRKPARTSSAVCSGPAATRSSRCRSSGSTTGLCRSSDSLVRRSRASSPTGRR